MDGVDRPGSVVRVEELRGEEEARLGPVTRPCQSHSLATSSFLVAIVSAPRRARVRPLSIKLADPPRGKIA